MYSKVRQIRKEMGITIQYMTDELGFKSPSTYSKKERGELPITVEEVKHICVILKISPLLFF